MQSSSERRDVAHRFGHQGTASSDAAANAASARLKALWPLTFSSSADASANSSSTFTTWMATLVAKPVGRAPQS